MKKSTKQLFVVMVRIDEEGREINSSFPTFANGFDDALLNAKAAAIALGVKIAFVHRIEQ